MKFYCFVLLHLCLTLSSCATGSDEEELGFEPVKLADPFIWIEDSTYYGYGTFSNDGLTVFSSSNLVEWYKHKQLALDKDNSYGDKWFWAPDMIYNEYTSAYNLYYAAENHMCVATSDSPLGPFFQSIKKPMADIFAVDHTIFKGEEGKLYMYYSTNFHSNYEIWVCELDETGLKIKPGSNKFCFRAEEPWECDQWSVTEGPYVIKYENMYYMIYSGSSYVSHNYAIGYAVSNHPLGPWTKYEKNPILIKPSCNGRMLYGIGHGSIFTDLDGKLRLVFHAHHSKDEVHPRAMYITSVHFTNDKIPGMYFGDEIIRAICIGEK